MASLAREKCVPCQGGEPKLSEAEIAELKTQVPDWQIVQEDGVKRLRRTFKFKNFRQALDFTNKVGELAEEQDHHPVLVTEWGKVTVSWWTHAIGGLHRNDMIMAARTDEQHREGS